MANANTDRNLLFGILALQMDFITREALITGMNAWVLAKAKPLGQLLVEQGALPQDAHALLEALMERHLAKHGQDPQKSLAAVSSVGSVREDLKRVADVDVQASLAHVSAAPRLAEDSYATRFPSQGAPTGLGQRFRILRPHARGGLGEVFVAQDQELNREIALKEIQDRFADHPESRTRFMLEAEITGGLEHPGIVPVYGLGQYGDGRPFYAMRFIHGDTLKDAIEKFHNVEGPGRDPGERALALRQLLGRFIDVCNAISYAHSRGVLHRDLKPGNIMLGQYGETLVVDWGLAKPFGQAETHKESGTRHLRPSSMSGTTPTQVGSAVGTPQFMSPEQAAGRLDDLGLTSDVYSLGATLYCLLTGQAPFDGSDVGQILNRVQRGDFPPPRQVKAAVHPALQAICLRAMALKPEERYPSPRALADDIEHWLADEPVSAWREPWTVKARRWMARHRTLVTAASAAVLVAVVSLTIAAVLLTAANRREREAKELAQLREQEAREQKEKAEANFQLARQAVDRYYTEISENVLLHEPGMEPLRKKLLEAAREFYDKFVQQSSGEPAVQVELGKALYRLALITGELDFKTRAIDLLQQALTTLTTLPADLAAGEDQQSVLAACHHHLGRLYRLTDQVTLAEASYQQALAIWEALVRRRPQETSYQAGLARSQLGLGNLYGLMGRTEQARTAYQTALVIRQQLAHDHPLTAEFQRDLATSNNNLAALDADTAQKEQAEQLYRQAQEVQAKLVLDYPMVSQYQEDLARTHFNLGNLYAHSGQPARAQVSYEAALGIWKQLVRDHSSVIDFQVKLAQTYNNLANMEGLLGQNDQAVASYQLALAVQEKIAAAFSTMPDYQAELARTHHNMGKLYRIRGLLTEAETAYQKALTIRKNLVRDFPNLPPYQHDLAGSYSAMGSLRLAGGDKKEAEILFRKALALWETLGRANPQDADYAIGLGICYGTLGDLVRDGGNPRAALDLYNQSIQVLERAGLDKTGPEEGREALRNAYWGIAENWTMLDDPVKALKNWDRLLELETGPNRQWFRLYRARTLARLGDHVQAAGDIRDVAGKDDLSGEALYTLGQVYALALGACRKDAKLTRPDQDRLADDYAHRALEMLNHAAAADFFKTATNLERVKKDKALDTLRSRKDFQEFLTKVEPQGKA